jgi:hypothetical protein
VALAQFYDDPWKEREWVEATKARLFYGYLDWVLADLEGMNPRDGEAAEEIDPDQRIISGELTRIPAICFCDIPRHLLSLHIQKYSEFGLSFTKRCLSASAN